MQPIHLAIGIVEGVVTAAVVTFVRKARPEILQEPAGARPVAGPPLRNVLLAFLAAAVLTGGVVSWFASDDPDGLEWAIAKTTGKEKVTGPGHGVHGMLTALQEKIAFLPDYSFRKRAKRKATVPGRKGVRSRRKAPGRRKGANWAPASPDRRGLITLALVFLAGFLLKGDRRPPDPDGLDRRTILDFKTPGPAGQGGTSLHRIDARAKVVVALVFILSVVSFDRYALTALLPFFLYPAVVLALGNLPADYFVRKVALFLPFAVAVGMLNPIFDREVMIRIGPFDISGGWVSCASIVVRAILTISAALLLVGVTGFRRSAARWSVWGCRRPSRSSSSSSTATSSC